MFNKAFFTFALIFAIVGSSIVSASPIGSYDDVNEISARARSSTSKKVPTVNTRYCEGHNIMEKTTQNGEVISNVVHTTCSSPATCVEYGNGRVLCGKA